MDSDNESFYSSNCTTTSNSDDESFNSSIKSFIDDENDELYYLSSDTTYINCDNYKSETETESNTSTDFDEVNNNSDNESIVVNDNESIVVNDNDQNNLQHASINDIVIPNCVVNIENITYIPREVILIDSDNDSDCNLLNNFQIIKNIKYIRNDDNKKFTIEILKLDGLIFCDLHYIAGQILDYSQGQARFITNKNDINNVWTIVIRNRFYLVNETITRFEKLQFTAHTGSCNNSYKKRKTTHINRQENITHLIDLLIPFLN